MEVTPIVAVTMASNPFGEFHSSTVKNNYLRVIRSFGGNPICINKYSELQLLDFVDALVIPGGRDVCPQLYNCAPTPKLSDSCEEDDEFEISVIKHCYEKGMPIFGICRGSQILNVAFGGTLYQHIDNHLNVSHQVSIKEDSLLFSICGKKRLDVNSVHHQAVDKLAPGFTTVATAEDGTIEAIENTEHHIIGVQWHPELLTDSSEEQQKLFEEFITYSRSLKALRQL